MSCMIVIINESRKRVSYKEIEMLKERIATIEELEKCGLLEFSQENHKKLSRFIVDSISEVFGEDVRETIELRNPFSVMKDGRIWCVYILEKLQQMQVM